MAITSTQARERSQKKAQAQRDALTFLEQLAHEYPQLVLSEAEANAVGLIRSTVVDTGDVVDYFAVLHCAPFRELREHLKGAT